MPDPIIQNIKDRLEIGEIIGSYIHLKKAGTNFKAPCPFHNEKTPSLMVSSQKQIWHCFGCGEGGDIFGFVMRYENLEFKETLKFLADKAGVALPQYRPADLKTVEEKDILIRINDFAARYFYEILLKDKRGTDALAYLKSRGLNEKTLNSWQIGFAPNEFHTLETALTKKQVKLTDMVKAGVLVKNEKGQVYDRFRGRIMFPIFNYLGEIVGFSARILPGLDNGKIGKYINSPETLIYNKSQILFGLNFAKDAIRKKNEVVVVEGQMDCVSAHQAGFLNTVATSGTALTQQQVTLISRLTKNIKFCFDQDSAGQIAAKKAGELALSKNFSVKLIVLKAVKDPDELIRKSPGLWEKAINEAVWFLDFYINLAEQQVSTDPVDRLRFLSANVIPLLDFISDRLEQNHYIKSLVQKFNISEQVIRQNIKFKIFQTETQTLGKNSKSLDPSLLEKEILGGLLCFNDFRAEISNAIKIEDFHNPQIRAIILEILQSTYNFELDGSTVAKEACFMIESMLEDLRNNSEVLKRQLRRDFSLLRLSSIKHLQQSLQLEIKKAENLKDKLKVEKLNQEFSKLSQERVALEKLI